VSELTDVIRAHAAGSLSRDALVRILTHFPYRGSSAAIAPPADAADVGRWWHEVEDAPAAPDGTWGEVELARHLDLLPADVYAEVWRARFQPAATADAADADADAADA